MSWNFHDDKEMKLIEKKEEALQNKIKKERNRMRKIKDKVREEIKNS